MEIRGTRNIHLAGDEAADAGRDHRRLRAAGQHQVRVAPLDVLRCSAMAM